MFVETYTEQMKSSEKDAKKVVSIDRLYFFGACESCGEIYEAQSRSDNLAGTEFKCKHTYCRGMVKLEKKSKNSIAVALKNASHSSKPRFC